MNLRQLEAFRAVMMVGSVTGAANAMHISQPGVSRLISDLEYSIGFKLFNRRKGRLYPSKGGSSFYEELERSFVGMESLKRSAQEIKEMRRGHLKIAAMPALCLELLPKTIKRFRDNFPEIKITLEVHNSPRIVEWVSARQFDIGFATLALDQPGVEIAHSFRTACVFVAPSGHHLEQKKVVHPQDLRKEPFVSLAQHTLVAMQIDHAFNKANVTRNIQIETQPSFSACSLVAQGIGVGLVDPLTANFFKHMKIVKRPFKPSIPFDFRIIHAAETTSSRLATLFIDQAHEYFISQEFISTI
jgi:DNA-binding transcriptional LysR family regulator